MEDEGKAKGFDKTYNIWICNFERIDWLKHEKCINRLTNVKWERLYILAGIL